MRSFFTHAAVAGRSSGGDRRRSRRRGRGRRSSKKEEQEEAENEEGEDGEEGEEGEDGEDGEEGWEDAKATLPRRRRPLCVLQLKPRGGRSAGQRTGIRFKSEVQQVTWPSADGFNN
jgi:hypothetical protein